MSNLRNRRVLASLKIDGKGIEYGALSRPLITREMSPGVKYVDFASRETLVKNYVNDPNVITENIVETDIVTDGNPIDGFVDAASLDYVVASHVFEHLPDPIRWLQSNLKLLKVGGRIGLALPDRRYCFDIAKPKSSLSDMVCAYVESRTKPSFAQVVQHIFDTRKVVAGDAWAGQTTASNAPLIRSPREALNGVTALYKRTDYIDAHCWKFSDQEFFDLIGEVKALFALPMDVVAFWPTQVGQLEFFVSVEKTAGPV